MGEESRKVSRIYSLDLLRGIAVILMVQQHTGYWFWDEGGIMSLLLPRYPVMVTMNGLGGLAAPLFILLAGSGASLSFINGKTGREIFLRGIALIIFGYTLNILTPAWFSPISWYVLHLIGLGLCLSPLMRGCSSALLFTIAAFITVLSVILLSAFNMPGSFSNAYMRGNSGITGIIKLAIIGGHFPLFPWIALFITGFISGRWIAEEKYSNLAKTAAVVLSVGIALFLIKQGNFEFLNNAMGRRLMIINLYMYPAYPMQFLALSAVSLLSAYAVIIAGNRLTISGGNILVLAGRVSLTIFILHIVIIRNYMVKSGLWQTFPEPVTILLQVTVIAIIMLLVYFWKRINFRFGFEWLLRFIR